MNGFFKTRNIVIGTTTLLSILAVSLLVITYQFKISLEQKLDRQKLRSEALLSEKLLLEESFAKSESKIAALAHKNIALNELVNDKTTDLTEQLIQNHQLKKALWLTSQQLKTEKEQAIDLKGRLGIEKELYTKLEYNFKKKSTSLDSLRLENVNLWRRFNELVINDSMRVGSRYVKPK
jgi:hypothetical protein